MADFKRHNDNTALTILANIYNWISNNDRYATHKRAPNKAITHIFSYNSTDNLTGNSITEPCFPSFSPVKIFQIRDFIHKNFPKTDLGIVKEFEFAELTMKAAQTIENGLAELKETGAISKQTKDKYKQIRDKLTDDFGRKVLGQDESIAFIRLFSNVLDKAGLDLNQRQMFHHAPISKEQEPNCCKAEPAPSSLVL